MFGEHHYAVEVEWQGDRGEGTSNYRAYGRQHVVRAEGKLHDLQGSSDRVFHGDRERWNPEELLIAALSQCHMLSYLHVATRHGVVVRAYTDVPTGTMLEDGRGGGAFSEVVLRATWPEKTLTGAEILDRYRMHGPFFTEESLERIERLKAEDRPPEHKWRRA